VLCFGYQRIKECLLGAKQDNQIQSDFPLQLVFTTSGTPSANLPLIPVGKAIHGKRQLTLTERVSQYNGMYSVYWGDLDGEKVVAKIIEDESLGEVLLHEASIYNHLSDLQGIVIPAFWGLFRTGHCHLLLTSDCGQSLSSFSTLSVAERYVFISYPLILLNCHQ
jgi:hypothetical protein